MCIYIHTYASNVCIYVYGTPPIDLYFCCASCLGGELSPTCLLGHPCLGVSFLVFASIYYYLGTVRFQNAGMFIKKSMISFTNSFHDFCYQIHANCY